MEEITVTMPGGATAVLRDPEEMTNGERKPILLLFRKYRRLGVTKDNAEGGSTIDTDAIPDDDIFSLTEIVTTAMVKSWSYSLQIPRDAEDPVAVLDSLPAHDYDVLAKAAMKQWNGGVDEEDEAKEGEVDLAPEPEADPSIPT